MSICKRVLEDVHKQAEIQKLKISDKNAESIATKTEAFICELLDCSSEICLSDKRKIVTLEDLKDAVHKRRLEFLYPLFE